MFASIVTDQRCDLFTVTRTDILSGDRCVLTYAPADYRTCVNRAGHYQRTFDPYYARYDYRVSSCN
jgi:hypothetical protein